MTQPLVSVVMAVYNCADTVLPAINSIKQQTYANWELIICDDSSTDGTADIIEQVASETDPSRLVLLKNQKNRKLAYSLNRCLAAASGQFVARMDGDDFSEPDRIERQMNYLMENPGVDLVGTSMRRFDHRGLGEIVHPASLTPDRWTLGRTGRTPFFHATILARRRVFDSVGGYTVAWRTARTEDLDLWYKFFAAGLEGRNLSAPLYRVREDRAAIRRRTPQSRIGGFLTRMKGNWSLGYPPTAYVRSASSLLKIFVPYRVFDWHRSWTRRRSESRGDLGGIGE